MKRTLFPLMAMLTVGTFIFYRAVHLPITHDEASTWLNFRHFNLCTCLHEYFCWQSANNHWLNSLLLQASASLFGEAPWALRLPNCIAGVLYALVASLICIRYLSWPALRIAGFILLTGHLYMLDFFSLARGYGLLACCVIWAIWCLLRYSESFSIRWLYGGIAALVLGVLSNFTGLLVFASFGASWLILMILNKKWPLLWRHGLLWVITAVGLYFILSYPIRMLMGNGEFAWGAATFGEMVQDLFRNLLYGAEYFGQKSALIVLVLVLLALIIAGIMFWIQPRKEKNALGLAMLLLLLTLITIEAEHRILGSNYPVGRKSIFLIPLLFFPIVLSLNFIRHAISRRVVALLISIVLLVHFRFAYPWGAFREWYFDAYYPQLFSAIQSTAASGDSIRLGSSWVFNPALQYYRSARSMPLAGLVYQKSLQIDSTMQYYWVEVQDTASMHEHGFAFVKTAGPCFLFKNSDPAMWPAPQ